MRRARAAVMPGSVLRRAALAELMSMLPLPSSPDLLLCRPSLTPATMSLVSRCALAAATFASAAACFASTFACSVAFAACCLICWSDCGPVLHPASHSSARQLASVVRQKKVSSLQSLFERGISGLQPGLERWNRFIQRRLHCQLRDMEKSPVQRFKNGTIILSNGPSYPRAQPDRTCSVSGAGSKSNPEVLYVKRHACSVDRVGRSCCNP